MEIIRDIRKDELSEYKMLIQPNRLYHEFNGPYYSRMSKDEIDKFILQVEKNISNNKKPIFEKKVIVNEETNELIGEVNWYWKSEETKWLEVGIVIFNEKYWGKGIGYRVLPKWIDEIFQEFPDIVRVGLSTWSGNIGMIKLAEKIGLKKEAEYKKARIVNNKYYDSLSYGILKNDWFKNNYEKRK